jgi:hypothetical protein
LTYRGSRAVEASASEAKRGTFGAAHYHSVATVRFTMRTQTGGFRTILADRVVTLPDDELPRVASRFQAQTETEVCSWVGLDPCPRTTTGPIAGERPDRARKQPGRPL